MKSNKIVADFVDNERIFLKYFDVTVDNVTR